MYVIFRLNFTRVYRCFGAVSTVDECVTVNSGEKNVESFRWLNTQISSPSDSYALIYLSFPYLQMETRAEMSPFNR